MGLNKKQVEFSGDLAKLLTYAFESGQPVIVSEVFRTKEQAQWYKDRGLGILNSAHRLKLAADLYRVVDGKVSWDVDEYRDLARYWKALRPENRAGIDFTRRDAVHFSREHNGVS